MTTDNHSAPDSLGAYLLAQGILTPQQLALVTLEKEATGRRWSEIVSSLGFVSHDVLVAALLDFGSPDFFDEERFTPAIPSLMLTGSKTMVVADIGDTLYLATLSDPEQVEELFKPLLPGRKFKFVPCSPERLDRYLARLKSSDDPGQLLESLIQRAVHRKVSDIHLVPKGNSYLVLFRYLGMRYAEHEGTLQEQAFLTSRIKDMARMDLAERRRPQDGAFSYTYEQRQLDLRVATVPTVHGEYVVLRLLDPATTAPTVNTLGITGLKRWVAGLSRSEGLCLVCGPTGSGKTTTLSASVKGLDRLGSAVFTVEDPVEAKIPLTGQVTINPEIGLDFGSTLKAFMRADPDVIVLGEIRDADSARNAMRAAETGHLVLATLHTESVFGSAQRLRDLGIPESELVHLLRAVLVQRLVRVVCPSCHGVGCSDCGSYGFIGRTVVSECAYFKDAAAVKAMLAGERSWPTLVEDAMGKADQGVTTRAEVVRVFGADAEAFIDELPLPTRPGV